MKWSIERSNMHKMFGDNNDKTKEIFSLIETNDKTFKYHLDRFKYATRFNNQELETHRNAAMQKYLYR